MGLYLHFDLNLTKTRLDLILKLVLNLSRGSLKLYKTQTKTALNLDKQLDRNWPISRLELGQNQDKIWRDTNIELNLELEPIKKYKEKPYQTIRRIY